jgi:hypothetical protein
MLSKKIKSCFILPILLLTLLFVFASALNTLIHNRTVQNYLLTRLGESAGYELEAGYMKFGFTGGLRATLHDLSAKKKSGTEKFTAASLDILLDAGEIIRGRIIPKKFLLFKPKIELSLTKSRHTPHKLEFDALIRQPLFKILEKIDYAAINDAAIVLKNQNIKIDNLFLQLSPQEHNKNLLAVDMYGSIEFRKEKSCFFTKGEIAPDGSGSKETIAALALKIKNLPLEWAPTPPSLLVKKGKADAKIDLQIMHPGSIFINARLLLNDLYFLINKAEGVKEHSLPETTVDFKADYFKNILNISSFNIKTDDYTLHANAMFDLHDKSDPYLDLKVRSPFMPLASFKKGLPALLVSRSLEETLYPYFRKGDVRFDLFALQGSFSRLAHLNKPENSECLLLEISLKDLEIIANKAALPYTGVSGRLVIKNGSLGVSGVKGIFGTSVIDSGSMKIDNLYSKKAVFTYYVKGRSNLKDIKQQAETAPLPEHIKTHIQKITSLSGKVDAELTCEHIRGRKNLKFKKSTLKLKDCSITAPGLKLPLLIAEADFNLEDNQKSIFYAKGMVGKSAFILSGQGTGIFKKGNADISFSADIDEILQKTTKGYNEIIAFDGIVPGRASLKRKDGGVWSCKGEIQPGGSENYKSDFSTLNRESGEKIFFDLDIIPGQEVILNKISANPGNTSIALSGFFGLKDMDTIYLKVMADPLHLEDVKFLFNGFEKPPTGTIKCSTEIKKTISNLSKIQIFGKCEASDISFSKCGLPFDINACNFKAEFSGQKILISSFESMLGNSSVSFYDSTLKGWNGLKGEINIEAEYLDLAGLISGTDNKCEKNKKKDLPDFIKNSDLSLNIKSNQGCWKQIGYNRLSAEIVFRDGIFSIANCDIKSATGNLKITGHIKSGTKPAPILNIYAKLNKHPIENIIQSFDILTDIHIVGADLSTEGYLSIKSFDKKKFISDLKGNFNLLLKDGVVKKSNVIFTILNFLSLKNIVDKKPSDFLEKGFRFNSIESNLNIEDGVLKIDNIVMQSPVFNMAGNGYLDLNNDKIDLKLVVSPLGTIDLLINKIPVVGYVLTGKEKSIITFYLNVKGSRSKPKIQYIPFQHWPASIFGFIKRTLLTPGRMFRNMTKGKNDYSGKEFTLPE